MLGDENDSFAERNGSEDDLEVLRVRVCRINIIFSDIIASYPKLCYNVHTANLIVL